MTKIVRKWSGQPEIVNKFTYGILPKHMGTLTTMFAIGIHIVHGNTLGTNLLSTYEFRYTFKDPSDFSRSCEHSVSKKTYIYLSDSLLGLKGAM
jgi:hypothetical protein